MKEAAISAAPQIFATMAALGAILVILTIVLVVGLVRDITRPWD